MTGLFVYLLEIQSNAQQIRNLLYVFPGENYLPNLTGCKPGKYSQATILEVFFREKSIL